MIAVVADGWAVLQTGVADVLSRCGVESVRCVGTATEALDEVAGVGLVVIGAVPDVAPHAAVRSIRALNPDLRILVLLESATREAALQVFDAGADAVLDRYASEQDLRDAAVRVAGGDRYISASVLRQALETTPSIESSLTAREAEVLALLVDGLSNRAIADALFIGEATVKTHLRSVFDKLGVANRVQAVAAAMELGLGR